MTYIYFGYIIYKSPNISNNLRYILVSGINKYKFVNHNKLHLPKGYSQ